MVNLTSVSGWRSIIAKVQVVKIRSDVDKHDAKWVIVRYAGNDRHVFWRIWNLEDTARTMRILSYLVILATFVKLTDSPWRSQEVLHRSVKVQWIHPFIHARKTRKSRNPFIKQSETCEALARPASLLRTRTCTTSPTSTCSSSTKLQLHTCVDTSRCQSQSFWFGTTDVL